MLQRQSWIFMFCVSSLASAFDVSGLRTNAYPRSPSKCQSVSAKHAVRGYRGGTLILSTSDSVEGETVESLTASARKLREEVKLLELEAQKTRPEQIQSFKPQPYPETLLDSCWKISIILTGKKDEPNPIPLRLTFSCQFQELDNILVVRGGGNTITRGYIWAPDLDSNDGKTYLAFDVQAQGIKMIPDGGKLYLNARVDEVEGGGYMISDGVVTIKEVDNRRGFGLFSFSGILAEFKVVGKFAAVPLASLEP